MFKITEGQYAFGGLTVFAVWLFVILPLLDFSGTHDMLKAAIKLAPLISAGILFLSLLASLCVALWTISSNRKIQQQLKAQDLWSTFLQKAIEYPALAYPPGHADRFDYTAKTIVNDECKPDKREYERYEWFLSYLLKTARQILEHFSADEFWKKTIRRNIRYHKTYLALRREAKSPDDFIELSGPEVTRLIDEVLREN